MCFSLFMICAGLTLPRTSGELWTSSGFASFNPFRCRLLSLLLLHALAGCRGLRDCIHHDLRYRICLVAKADTTNGYRLL